MPRKPTKPLLCVSPEKDFRRTLRKGQQDLFDVCKHTTAKQLSVKWPGGYGKSLGIALAFREMVARGKCDRLLVVVANDTQREQMLNDFRQDAQDVALTIPQPWKVTTDVATFRACEAGVAVVFVATIQQVSAASRGGLNYMLELMRHGSHSWMLAADEYHHYAKDMDWGTSLKSLVNESVFCLATSATPYRDGKGTIFNKPDLEVSYNSGVSEGALKPICRRVYSYRIDYINASGEPVQFTSEEIREKVFKHKGINVYQAKKGLRMSSKYVLPIVSEPIHRLRSRRNNTGKPLQMLVRAMSCEHAKVTCDQIANICDDLSVDWMGTGEDGRSDAENRNVRDLFCPRKDARGVRPKPKLDILVQVGMADEGFDSIMVAEIVDLHIVTLNGASTKTKQFYKRGTRAVGGEELYINVGSDHPLAALEGNQVQEWIDSDKTIPEVKNKVPPVTDNGNDDWDLADSLPYTQERLVDAEFTDMDVYNHEAFPGWCLEATADVKADCGYEPTREQLCKWFKAAIGGHRSAVIEPVQLEEQRKHIAKSIGQVAHAALRLTGREFQKSMVGDYMKRINQKAIQQFDKRREEMLPEELELLYEWVKQLHKCIKNKELPSWLK